MKKNLIILKQVAFVIILITTQAYAFTRYEENRDKRKSLELFQRLRETNLGPIDTVSFALKSNITFLSKGEGYKLELREKNVLVLCAQHPWEDNTDKTINEIAYLSPDINLYQIDSYNEYVVCGSKADYKQSLQERQEAEIREFNRPRAIEEKQKYSCYVELNEASMGRGATAMVLKRSTENNTNYAAAVQKSFHDNRNQWNGPNIVMKQAEEFCHMLDSKNHCICNN